MSKIIKVTTDDKLEILTCPDDPDNAIPYDTLSNAVGGLIEIVRPVGLPKPYVMLVNEEGLCLELPINNLGCQLYGTIMHGAPIVGNICFVTEGWVNGEPDLIGLTDEKLKALCTFIETVSCGRIHA